MGLKMLTSRLTHLGADMGGLGAEPPAAGGQWGVWGREPPEARGSESGAHGDFYDFTTKITHF